MTKERETLEITGRGDSERSAEFCHCGLQNVVCNRSNRLGSISAHRIDYYDYSLPKWLVLTLGVLCLIFIGFLVRRNS